MVNNKSLEGKKSLSFDWSKKTILISMLVILLIVATGFVWAHKKVNIIVDGNNIEVHTIYNNPQDVLKQAKIILKEQDEYILSSAKLDDNATIEVFRAVPVTVRYQGKIHTILTGKATVRDVAASLGIPTQNVKLIPDEKARPQAGMDIKAITLHEETVNENRLIPYSVIRKPDSSLEKDMEQTGQQGVDGLKEVVVKISFADSEQVNKEDVSETVIKEPQPQIIHVGTRDMVSTSRGMERFRRIAHMEATAYNPTDGSEEGLTATGIKARHGIAAVDPDVIPLGSRLYIPGYGLALAADTGGDIVNNRIDLCMEDYDDAYSFGRRDVKVYILAE